MRCLKCRKFGKINGTRDKGRLNDLTNLFGEEGDRAQGWNYELRCTNYDLSGEHRGWAIGDFAIGREAKSRHRVALEEQLSESSSG